MISSGVVDPEALLTKVRKPSRYCGNEVNARLKAWDGASLRLALAFPDMYEIGMSHQGLQILYHIINDRPDLLAERVYTPDTDLEELLRQEGLPLFSHESRHAVSDFDLLAITLPYELCATNILTMLDLAGLPFRADERDSSHPLLLAGGPGAFNPEPVADFFDAILLGDGEEAIVEISDLLLTAKEGDWPRQEILQGLAGLEGVYVPAFFGPRYDGAGNFQGVSPLGGQESVRRRVLPELGEAAARPLVPLGKIVHDRLGLEVARGCTRGCRFCQAGMIYRPVRERDPLALLATAKTGIAATGFEELALLSLSTGDYSCLSPLLVNLMDHFAKAKVSVSLPSMRVGTLTPEVMTQIKRVRKSGFTVAPEAGTDRLRRVINKGITEEDLLTTSAAAFELGWKHLKFYFMFGLPTETDEDVAAIAELARKAMKAGHGPGRAITVSVATFVPKPHTPFQWHGQLSIEEGYARIDQLKDALRGSGIKLRWGNPKMSFLEGVFARGDRSLSRLIEAAWRRGARFDAWGDYFSLETWRQAALELGLELDSYLRPRAQDEPLPWDHLDSGVSRDFLAQELAAALEESYTPDCRLHGCQKCGLCDFKEVFPRTCAEREADMAPPAGPPPLAGAAKELPVHHRYRIDYSRLGRARLLSHLELLQLFFRAFNRVGLPLHYSKGFNPSPKVSFSPALPLGTESHCEYLLVDCIKNIDGEAFMAALNETLPQGMAVSGISRQLGKTMPARVVTTYRITVLHPLALDKLSAFVAAEEFPVTVIRKKKERQVDARELVQDIAAAGDNELTLQLLTEVSRAGLKPMEIVRAIFGLSDEQVLAARVVKTAISNSG
ncbi:MAG: TIGR03960 family B12-binding radical SAM protein [Thermodesulfobacteriota bacterium]